MHPYTQYVTCTPGDNVKSVEKTKLVASIFSTLHSAVSTDIHSYMPTQFSRQWRIVVAKHQRFCIYFSKDHT